MAFEHDYQAPEPIAVEDITVGTVCTVPVWRQGEIIDWAQGKVIGEHTSGESWLVYIQEYDKTQMYYSYSINKPIDKSTWLKSGALNWHQQMTVEHLRGLNVPANWFVGERGDDGSVEVVAIGSGEEPTFVWTFRIETDGGHNSNEANDVLFSSGITV